MHGAALSFSDDGPDTGPDSTLIKALYVPATPAKPPIAQIVIWRKRRLPLPNRLSGLISR